MKQYVIIAKDGVDDNALERRMSARPQHLAGAKALKDAGNYVVGGALLTDAGQMAGSVMIVQFETEQELQAWRESEPYINGKVWETIEVHPFRVADV
jgi:uncharacterized protein YciI